MKNFGEVECMTSSKRLDSTRDPVHDADPGSF